MPLQPSPLSRLFVATRGDGRDADPSAREVAFGRGGKRSFDDLAHDVARLAAALAAHGEAAGAARGAAADARHGRARWLLHTEDSYAACVGVLALAQARCLALLAPNRQPETLRRLARGSVGALLEPRPDAQALGDLPVLDPLAPGLPERGGVARARPLEALDPNAPVLELLTSGTTGEGTRVVKTLAHLEREVETLEARFAARLPAAARIFATVSHQHIYGLLFRLLWPVAAGRPLHADTPLHPQELLPRMQEAGACALVATPVHLRRLAGAERLRELRPICSAVFSSGGPLAAETARALAAALGAAPFEILGSTETGGVAVRQQADAGVAAWQPLPGVAIAASAEDGRLVVSSPFVSCGEALGDGRRRFTMGDRVELQGDGRFLLLARADRVVKVGEKRLALPTMERALEAHADVAEAALLVLPRAGEPRVHAVVVPTRAGRETLRREGRRAFGARLAEHLAGSWDRVLLPRAWRVVAELPRDAQGKLPVAGLRALFERNAHGLEVTAEERVGSRLVQQLRVPEELPGLEGHFEGFPVVPGVMQIGWALEAAGELLGETPRVRRLEAVKFPTLLRPGEVLRLEVELDASARLLRFTLAAGRHVTASGRCVLGPASAEIP